MSDRELGGKRGKIGGPLRLAVVALGCAWGLLAEAPNLVPNPGFEEVSADGRPAAWGGQGASATTASTARTGSRGLLYERRDRAEYRLVGTALELTPGRAYEIAAWVRTDSVTPGEGGGATICLEWTRGGAFYGGEYPKGVTGSSAAWTLVRGVAKVPADADRRVRLVCYLRKTATGTAWFDDVSVREFTDFPLVGSLRTACYRDQTAGGPVRVSAGLALRWAQVPVADAVAELTARNARDEVVARLPPTDLRDDAVEFVLDATAWPVGRYTLRCTVREKAGGREGVATGRLERLDSLGQRLAYIDGHGRLIVNGEPFFPLGMYWNAHFDRTGEAAADRDRKNARWPKSMNREHLDLYAQSPFNCLMPYDSWNASRADLDAAHGKGLRVIFSVKDTYFGPGGACHRGYGITSQADERRAIAAELTRVGDHPAIIAWYINDEIHPDHIDRLRLHQQWLEELDPGRPTWSVSYHRWEDYGGSFDVFGGDPYPIPQAAIRTVWSTTRRVVDSVGAGRPVWMVPQVFDHASYSGQPEQSRPPTLEEMRAMAWMCIAGGANGLVFYSFFDLVRMDPLQPFEGRWRDVTAMAAEIKALIPVLLSADPVPADVRADAPGAAVVWRLFAHQGSLYLVTVNTSREPATASFAFADAPTAAQTVLGQTPAGLNGTAVALTYAPIETKIVRLSVPAAPPAR